MEKCPSIKPDLTQDINNSDTSRIEVEAPVLAPVVEVVAPVVEVASIETKNKKKRKLSNESSEDLFNCQRLMKEIAEIKQVVSEKNNCIESLQSGFSKMSYFGIQR